MRLRRMFYLVLALVMVAVFKMAGIAGGIAQEDLRTSNADPCALFPVTFLR